MNVDPADATKNYVADAMVRGDAAAGAHALALGLPPADAPVWADLTSTRRRARGAVRGDHPEEIRFLEAFARVVGDDVTVVVDMCVAGYWLAAMHAPAGPRKFQYPMGWGTLGYAFPAALGAAAHGPTLSVSGDGGFLFAVGELATAKQEDLPLTALVVDDGGYGMLRFDQRHAGVETYGVDLATPDFVALAEAFGIRASRVDGLSDDFASALAEHLADPSPSLLVARAQLAPPPTTSPLWHRAGPPAWKDPLAGLG